MGLVVLLAHLLVGGEPQLLPPPAPPPRTIEIFAPPAQHWVRPDKPGPPPQHWMPEQALPQADDACTHDCCNCMVDLQPKFD